VVLRVVVMGDARAVCCACRGVCKIQGQGMVAMIGCDPIKLASLA